LRRETIFCCPLSRSAPAPHVGRDRTAALPVRGYRAMNSGAACHICSTLSAQIRPGWIP